MTKVSTRPELDRIGKCPFCGVNSRNLYSHIAARHSLVSPYRKRPQITIACSTCGNTFTTYITNKGKPYRTFCSLGCAFKARRGRQLSAEHRSKIGKAHQGKTPSEEARLKISQSLKARGREQIRRKKSENMKRLRAEGRILPWNKGYGDYIKGDKNPRFGRPLSNETRIKISQANKARFVGDKNPNWKGGRTLHSRKIYYGDNWYEIKKQVCRRNNYRCAYCDKRFNLNRLVAHHVIPVREIIKEPETLFLLYYLDNLIPLCHSCHGEIENSKEYKRELAEELLFILMVNYPLPETYKVPSPPMLEQICRLEA